jgi:ribosomal protein S18 acetylase RimI-like enzyme
MTNTNILIRLGRPADIEAVRRLLVETWHDTYDSLIGAEKVTEITNSWHSIENLSRQLTMPDTSFLVAKEDGAIVGHLFANGQRPPVLMLSRLYVLPDRQRRGIGGRIIAEAIARHSNCDVMRLEVEADNLKGVSFYRSKGFQPVDDRTEEGIAHIVMEKAIGREG